MEFELQKEERSIIKVIGVGGGGSNAVTHMYKQGIVGVDFAICNTDNQALELSPVPVKIQLGPNLTEGRGAGSKPEVGKQACIESIEDVVTFLEDNTKMLFVTAGMGGGTGTGAAPIIAKVAREMGILTVGIVTLPFKFEGMRRGNHASDGLAEIRANVDALIMISNDKLREIYGNLSISEAFSEADNVLTTAAKGIAEIITVPGYVNVDFEDVNTVMRDSGVAIMGTATAQGQDRAKKAVVSALSSSLLKDTDIKGAKHILLNITSGSKEVTMDEVAEITDYIQTEAGYGTDLIWGNCFDAALDDKLSVTIIATGFGINEECEEEGELQVENIALENLDRDSSNKANLGIRVNESTSRTQMDEDVKNHPSVQKYTQNLSDEPYLSQEKTGLALSQESTVGSSNKYPRQNAEQKEYVRINTVKLNNPQSVLDLEKEPAYKRRQVALEDINHSSEHRYSRYVISSDENPEIRMENRYLHDNAD
jgi:cell division protein FtsZ